MNSMYGSPRLRSSLGHLIKLMCDASVNYIWTNMKIYRGTEILHAEVAKMSVTQSVLHTLADQYVRTGVCTAVAFMSLRRLLVAFKATHGVYDCRY